MRLFLLFSTLTCAVLAGLVAAAGMSGYLPLHIVVIAEIVVVAGMVGCFECLRDL